jgi:uncharacterized protein with FMN-binding domain
MRKGRGKGKISNDLVAASCAAVLAVYAAGYFRTRDAARRFEIHARDRQPTVPTEPASASPRPIVIEAPMPQSVPGDKANIAVATGIKPAPKAPRVATRRPAPASDTRVEASTVAAGPSSQDAPQEIQPVPLPAQEVNPALPIAITREPTSVSASKWRDGTYTGLGDSPHGDIEARVVIKDGRIVEAGIATCDTRYPCSVIDPLIHQPLERQSPDVDYMSHATESSDAYYYALVAALENARERAPSDATNSK